MADLDEAPTSSASLTSCSVSSVDSSQSTPSQASTPPSSSHTTSSATGTPRSSGPRFPVRIGITWKKGEKLEAMDFSRTWYPSKIVEIDAAEKHVLIHFEGWNSRYDEWVAMDSDKLRPVTRHSERKDKGGKKRRIHPHPIYRAGEQVLAKWSDCKRYPAKVSRQMEDGTYEVVFYDGVSRYIQPINIRPMPEEMKHEKHLAAKVPPVPRKKLSFKHIKVTLPESVKRRQEQRDKSRLAAAGKILAKKKKSPPKVGDHSKFPPKISLKRDPGQDTYSIAKTSLLKMKGITRASVEREATISTTADSENLQIIVSSADVAATSMAAATATQASSTPASTVTSPTTDPQAEVVGADVSPTEAQGTSQQVVPIGKGHRPPGLKRTKRRSNTDPYLQPKRKKLKSKLGADPVKTHKLVKRPPSLTGAERAKSLDTPATPLASPSLLAPLVPPQVFVPSKAFIVEEDHNPFKCAHEGCNKEFRKENLLAYHIKYYHTEPDAAAAGGGAGGDGVTSPLLPMSTTTHSPMGTPGQRKRRQKHNSVCSTDSDMSASSKGKSGKRQRHDSEISVTAMSPDNTHKDLWADVKPLRVSQDGVADDAVAMDTEEEDVDMDIVNCICGLRETSGLMIQCDVCMCWQHFTCVDTKNTGVPPANYVCFICENTPGVRESCRYMSDMGWERRGELPTFPFSSDATTAHLKSIACECNELTSTLQHIKSALHSTRRQIKISKEEDDHEFQLWQTDWDNWTKPEEDLTLTPRSADPDLSPTPSTFLFPPTSQLSAPPVTASNLVPALSPSASVSSIHSSSSSSSLTPTPASTITSDVPPSSDTQTTLTSSSAAPTVASEAAPAAGTTSPTTPSTETTPGDSASSVVTPPSGSLPSDVSSTPFSSHTTRVRPHTSSVDQGGHRVQGEDRSEVLARDLFPGPSGDNQHSISHPGTLSHLPNGDETKEGRAEDNTSNTDRAPDTGTGHRTSESHISTIHGSLLSPSSANVTTAIFPSELSSTQSHSHSASAPSNTASTKDSGSSNQTDTRLGASLAAVGTSSSSSAASHEKNDQHSGQSNPSTESTSTKQGSNSRPNNSQADSGQAQLSSTGPGSVQQSEGGEGAVATSESSLLPSLYVNVNGGQGHQEEEDNQDNDTDTAEESVDPYRNCEENLLVHVTRVHSDIEKQLEMLGQQIIDLENSEHSNPTVQLSEENVLNDIPALKKSLNKLSRNLLKVHRLCVQH